MNAHARDALLALATLGVMVWSLVALDAASALLAPQSVALGVLAAVAVEAVFVLETPAAALWERPFVQAGSVLTLVVGGWVAVRLLGPWVLGAVVWGLVTFLALLVLVVAGRRNPVAVALGR